MRKILTILLILPFFSFAQCLEITEEDLIGKSFKTNWDDSKGLTFDSNGFFRVKGKEKSHDYRWCVVDQMVFYKKKYKPRFSKDTTQLYFVRIAKAGYKIKYLTVNDEYMLSLFSNNIVNKGFQVKMINGEGWVLFNGKTKIGILNYSSNNGISNVNINDDYSSFFKKNIFSDTKGCIEQYHSDNYNKWEKKGEYEKSEDYKNRVTEISKKNKSESLMKEALRLHKEFAIKSFNNNFEKPSKKIVIKDYNADNETFLIEIKNFEPINFPISISEAESFKNNFYPPKFSNLDLHYLDGRFLVSKITINDYKYTLFTE